MAQRSGGSSLPHFCMPQGAQLRVACIQYIRDMFDAVSLSDGWAALSEEMRRPIVELGKPKAPARAVSCEGRR